MSHSLESFTEHVADSIRENLEEAQTMKDTTSLQITADKIENLYSVEHTRMVKAQAIVKAQGIKKLPNGNYQVPSETDSNHLYQVSIEKELRCNCPDFAKRHTDNSSNHLCKHIGAVLVWHTLPDVPITSPELEEIKAFLFAPLNIKVTA